MRKRLDLQSLLEKCDQDELNGFLRSSFAKDPNLATQFLVHFASSFDLDEDEFQYITKRIDRLLSYRPEKMTQRKAVNIRGYLQDMIEQSRDSISKRNYRQAFVILSGMNNLIDPYLDRISENHGFLNFQEDIYHFLEIVFHETPAPSLKKKIIRHYIEIIENGKAIPFFEDENPYWLWMSSDPSAEKRIIRMIQHKLEEWPEYQSLFLRQWVRIAAGDPDLKQLERLLHVHGDELDLYQFISEYLPEGELDLRLKDLLEEEYSRTSRRSIRGKIFHVFQTKNLHGNEMQELSLLEFLETGDVKILDMLTEGGMSPEEITHWLVRSDIPLKDKSRRIHLYRGLEHLNALEILKEQIILEPDIFVLLQFIDSLYIRFPEEIRNRMWMLIEKYLNDHFGLPAFNRINDIVEELAPMRYEGLQNFLIQKIRNTFGHRKHFQKLMKELAG